MALLYQLSYKGASFKVQINSYHSMAETFSFSEPRTRDFKERETGLEPATLSLEG